tara:strand:+ start:499 stop:1347 length:849 start_codon:yes stop_codon:yes gene_type:complete
MGNQDLNILAVAHKEFMEQMTDVLTPFLLTTFDDLYEKAVIDSNKKNILKKFQAYVKEIKSWNQGMIVEHTNAIEASCAHFKNLLAMLFVGYVKILSSIRLKDNAGQKIPIRLPKSTDFIYSIYKEVGKHVYKDPYWIADDDDEDKVSRMTKLLNDTCLPDVIKSMSPMAKILETNMGTNIPTEIETGETMSDGEDPEVIGSDDEAPDAPVVAPEAEVPGESAMDTPAVGESLGEEEEHKDVQLRGQAAEVRAQQASIEPPGDDLGSDDDDDVLNPGFKNKT